MPAKSFDTNTIPKAPTLTYVSVGASPTKVLAELIDEHCQPRDLHNAPAIAGKRRAHNMSEPEQAVVVVSHLCGTQEGRRQVVLGLRDVGLSPQAASMLGFATSVHKGATVATAVTVIDNTDEPDDDEWDDDE